jgi:8-oxo-dGTP pyrophosphatase MutT (NUDIX family)
MDGYIGWLRARVGHDKIQLVFAIACVLRDGAVLLQERGDTGGWGFPGGAVELGETAHDAAVREVLEETGVRVEVTGLIGVYTGYEQAYPSGDVAQPVLIAFTAAPIDTGDAAPLATEETLAARYIALEDEPRLFNQQHQDVLADLVAGRRGVFR